jgi:hypothetical protein
MKRLALAALLALASAAQAQQQPQPVSPAALTGYATLSVLAASIPLSGATLGPNSAAFPAGSLPNRYMTVRNSVASANTLSVCPLGGTCTVAAGIPLAAGESQTWFFPASQGQLLSPTVISGGTATAVVSW